MEPQSMGKYFQRLDKQDPARISLEKNIASLENGSFALAFSSGLAACYTITKLLRAGDHILVADDLYGGSYLLIEGFVSNYDITVSYIDTADLVAIEKAIRPNTKLLWTESPANPSLKLADIAAVATLAKKHGIITVVDNTLATPYLQKPLDLGADIVIHNSVKYLSGDSNIIGGAIVTNDSHLFEQLQSCQNSTGDHPESVDCFRTLKGIQTLASRVQQQEKSAKKIAQFLSAHLSVETVHYPGFGNMLAFELKGGKDAAIQLLRETLLFALREKTIELSAGEPSALCSAIAHAKIPPQVLAKGGINGADSLVRLTIGPENVDDLINDLAGALQAVDHQLIQFPDIAADLRECI